LTATLLIPLLLSLARIHTNDIHFARSCGVHQHATETERKHPAILFKDHRLLTFAICLFLFQLANASLLTLLGQNLVRAEGSKSSLVVSALVVLPQIIVALLAPSVGSMANSIGRRPLLIVGLAAVPIRSTVFAFTADPTLLIVIQLLDGLSGATLGVLTALVVADLTQGTGRFNLAQGVVGALSAVGASLSTSLSGIVYQKFGQMAGLLSVTAVGILSVVIVVAFMPETRPFSRPQTRASTTPPSP
jgi:MFS family permease